MVLKSPRKVSRKSGNCGNFGIPRKVPQILRNAVLFVTWKCLKIQTGIFHQMESILNYTDYSANKENKDPIL